MRSQPTERTMPSFHNKDCEIAYRAEGEGDPILLVHGFASTKNVNWVYPTWVSELKKSGRRVIALDNRGHGESGKLYEPAAYHIGTMAGDVSALMDHLGIERADIMGYSLGSRMTAWLALHRPQRLPLMIFGGIGSGLIERADIMACRLGSRMSAWLALNGAQRLHLTFFGGIKTGLIEGAGPGENKS